MWFSYDSIWNSYDFQFYREALGTYFCSFSAILGYFLISCAFDPYIDIFFRRIIMLRRIIVKHPHCLTMMRDVARLYRAKGVPGAFQSGDGIAQLTPAPPPGAPDRHQWKSRLRPKGPVGLLTERWPLPLISAV